MLVLIAVKHLPTHSFGGFYTERMMSLRYTIYIMVKWTTHIWIFKLKYLSNFQVWAKQ